MTDIQETGSEVAAEKGSIDHLGAVEQDTFDYKVPSDSPVESERGKEYKDNPFQFRQIAKSADGQDTDALEVIRIKGWDLTDMVNKLLKGNARSNAYQAKMAPHKASEVDPEKAFEQTVRNLVKQGVPEAMAREVVKNTLLAAKG